MQRSSISVSKTEDQGSNPCSFAKQKVPAELTGPKPEAYPVRSCRQDIAGRVVESAYTRDLSPRASGIESSTLSTATKAEGPLAQQARAPGS